jgi:hypothetical protein
MVATFQNLRMRISYLGTSAADPGFSVTLPIRIMDPDQTSTVSCKGTLWGRNILPAGTIVNCTLSPRIQNRTFWSNIFSYNLKVIPIPAPHNFPFTRVLPYVDSGYYVPLSWLESTQDQFGYTFMSRAVSLNESSAELRWRFGWATDIYRQNTTGQWGQDNWLQFTFTVGHNTGVYALWDGIARDCYVFTVTGWIGWGSDYRDSQFGASNNGPNPLPKSFWGNGDQSALWLPNEQLWPGHGEARAWGG